ncbi:MAG TPA: nucleotidyl transferase AbiEii/AbiGii toxin family protein, partial [Balneolaceae bacterium]|nr:nucleotidyl transferase AbiEii/AbiGii toxin family protein [Balneolaceae bacterium]
LDPFIGPVLSNLDIKNGGAAIPCVLPKRTFLEKVFLLHEEFQKNPEELRAERLSRHLYDVERMMDGEHAQQALEDEALYRDIVRHRRNLIGLKGIDYDRHWPGSINLNPPDSVQKEWKQDYKNMQESMIYGETLTFEALLGRMEKLTERINSLEFEK